MDNNQIEQIEIVTSDNRNITLYKERGQIPKGVLLYIHGGGLLYGDRNDLPKYHIDMMCKNQYAIVAYDYKLGPKHKLPEILDDIITLINWYLENRSKLLMSNVPYFLWGRSAGAYLCLLAAREKFDEAPKGILSYYGYGLLEDHWANEPNPYYNKFPSLEISDLNEALTREDESINSRYSLYVNGRQKGTWLSFIYDEPYKTLLLKYSFRIFNDKNFPPVFLTHSFNDPDVPCSESMSLNKLLDKSEIFLVSSDTHNYDRFTESSNTIEVINRSIWFLDHNINKD